MPWDRPARQLHERSNDHRQSDPTDDGRAIVGPMPVRRGKTGRPRGTGLREAFDGGRHIPATGCHWCASASGHPPFSTGRNRFRAWRRGGLPERVPNRLRDPARRCAGRSPGPTVASNDSCRRRPRRAAASAAATRKEGQRAQAAHRRGHQRHADRHDRPLGRHPGPGRRAGGRREAAGTVPTVRRPFADGGHPRPKPRGHLRKTGLANMVRTTEEPKDVTGFTVPAAAGWWGAPSPGRAGAAASRKTVSASVTVPSPPGRGIRRHRFERE